MTIGVVTKGVGIAAGLGAAMIVGGCANVNPGTDPKAAPQSSLAPSSPVEWPPASYTGLLDHSLDFPVLGVELSPPALGTVARVDWTAAYGSCSDAASCPAGTVAPTIFLALATTDNGGKIESDGSVTRTLSDRLTYVLRWDNIQCSPSGHIPGDTSSPTVTTCVWITLVDANTGAFLGGGQTNAAGG
jgi:hypothetical protein